MMRALAVGVAKPMVVVKLPLVPVKVAALVPCRVRFKLDEPTVSAADGVIVLSAVVLVMSALAPEAAAPRLVRAVLALVAPVPPSATLKAVVNVSALNAGLEPVAISCGVDNVIVPKLFATMI